MRGRKPLPTAVHEMQGTYKKNPQRRRGSEPQPPPGAPECPGHLDDVAQEEWAMMCQILSDMGVLSKADRAALELYCQSYSDWRKACENVEKFGQVLVDTDGDQAQPAKRNPYDLIKERCGAACLRLLVEFGLTPSSRTRVSATSTKEDDPLAEYLRHRQSA